MASPEIRKIRKRKAHKPEVSEPLSDLSTYLGFDNSRKLQAYRLGRLRAMETVRQNQQSRHHNQLVQALNTAIAETTLGKSSEFRGKVHKKGVHILPVQGDNTGQETLHGNLVKVTPGKVRRRVVTSSQPTTTRTTATTEK